MASVKDLKIYGDCRKLRLDLLDSYEHFPKKYRYTLGNEILQKSDKLLDEVTDAGTYFDKKKKLYHLTEALCWVNKLENSLILAGYKQCLTDEHMGKYILAIPEITKQISGLIRSLKSQIPSSTDEEECL